MTALSQTPPLTPAQKLGRRIRLARVSANLSQTELAKKLFLSQDSVGRWERGQSVPSMVQMIAIAEILGQSLEYFVGKNDSSL